MHVVRTISKTSFPMTFVDFERGAAGYMIGGITGSAGTIELATVVFDSSE